MVLILLLSLATSSENYFYKNISSRTLNINAKEMLVLNIWEGIVVTMTINALSIEKVFDSKLDCSMFFFNNPATIKFDSVDGSMKPLQFFVCSTPARSSKTGQMQYITNAPGWNIIINSLNKDVYFSYYGNMRYHGKYSSDGDCKFIYYDIGRNEHTVTAKNFDVNGYYTSALVRITGTYIDSPEAIWVASVDNSFTPTHKGFLKEVEFTSNEGSPSWPTSVANIAFGDNGKSISFKDIPVYQKTIKNSFTDSYISISGQQQTIAPGWHGSILFYSPTQKKKIFVHNPKCDEGAVLVHEISYEEILEKNLEYFDKDLPIACQANSYRVYYNYICPSDYTVTFYSGDKIIHKYIGASSYADYYGEKEPFVFKAKIAIDGECPDTDWFEIPINEIDKDNIADSKYYRIPKECDTKYKIIFDMTDFPSDFQAFYTIPDKPGYVAITDKLVYSSTESYGITIYIKGGQCLDYHEYKHVTPSKEEPQICKLKGENLPLDCTKKNSVEIRLLNMGENYIISYSLSQDGPKTELVGNILKYSQYPAFTAYLFVSNKNGKCTNEFFISIESTTRGYIDNIYSDSIPEKCIGNPDPTEEPVTFEPISMSKNQFILDCYKSISYLCFYNQDEESSIKAEIKEIASSLNDGDANWFLYKQITNDLQKHGNVIISKDIPIGKLIENAGESVESMLVVITENNPVNIESSKVHNINFISIDGLKQLGLTENKINFGRCEINSIFYGFRFSEIVESDSFNGSLTFLFCEFSSQGQYKLNKGNAIDSFSLKGIPLGSLDQKVFSGIVVQSKHSSLQISQCFDHSIKFFAEIEGDRKEIISISTDNLFNNVICSTNNLILKYEMQWNQSENKVLTNEYTYSINNFTILKNTLKEVSFVGENWENVKMLDDQPLKIFCNNPSSANIKKNSANLIEVEIYQNNIPDDDSPYVDNGKKSNTGVIVGSVIGVLVVVAIAVGVAFFFYKKKQNDKHDETTTGNKSLF